MGSEDIAINHNMIKTLVKKEIKSCKTVHPKLMQNLEKCVWSNCTAPSTNQEFMDARHNPRSDNRSPRDIYFREQKGWGCKCVGLIAWLLPTIRVYERNAETEVG